MTKHVGTARDRGRHDFAYVVVIALAAFATAIALDLNESIVVWGAAHPNLDWLGIEEMPVGFTVFNLGIAWYAFRRWRERREEARAHLETLGNLQRAMDEVVAANQAKAQFLAAMSHELRTPLNAIIGFSEMIRDEAVGPVSATYRDYANDIHVSGSHLLAIVNDILDMARLEAGALQFEPGPVSASALLNQVSRIVQRRAAEGGVELRVVLAEEMILHADKDKLHQALLNLVHNAVKFTPAGGAVTISGAMLEGMARLRISDTGIGIAEKDIATALTPFRQIDGVLHRKYEGAGLGLPLAKRYVERQGGSLELASEVGRGTVVTVTMPLDSAAEDAPAPSRIRQIA